MTINFNVSPYFDDFDPTKNFHRILFKPGYAVQARELTQSQTILQNQISNFASAIYSQNTPISGGKITTNLNCYYIRLNFTYNNVNISAGNFLNKTISDATGTVLAKVIATSEGVSGGDPPTLVVTYISGTQFTDNNIITPNDGSNYQAQVSPSVTGTPSTGLSSVASVSSGVYYIVNGYSQSSTPNADGTYNNYSIGNFVQVNPQTIILSKYNNNPSYRVGLEINESIISYASDSSLLDPAIGASNYQAPGADRYQITLTLTTFPLIVGGDASFIELVRIENGTIVKQSDTTVYSAIDDYFAKRDYETNGDYVVQDFKLTPSANTSNTMQYNLSISKGVAYVRGYRVENQSTKVLTSDRARTTQTVPSNSMFVDYGNYFVVDTANGVFDVTTQPTIDLHCVVAANILSTNTNVYSSTLVGTGVIRGWQYVNSNGSNTASYVFNAYVSDIVTNTLSGNTLSATSTTITFNDINGTFSQSANAYYGAIININSGTNAGDSRTIVSYNVFTKTATVSPAFTQTPDSTSKFTISLAVSNINSVVQKNGTYGLTANANISISGGGKSSPTLSAPTVLQLGGAPELIFPLGYAYANTVSNTTYYTTQVFRNQGFNATSKTLTLNTTAPLAFQGPVGTPFNGNVFKQLYTLINNSTGQILDFSTSGNTANITSATSIVFTSNTYSSVSNVTVIASMYVSNGDGSTNILKTKTLNTGNTKYGSTGLTSITGVSNTTLDLTNGQAYILNAAVNANTPFSLYVTDVKKISKIIDTGNPSVSASGQALSGFTDVTTSYALNNGQRDSHYDFATLKLLPGVPRPKGNLLVVFNYYSHGGGDGYFSINSYTNESYSNIPFYTAKDGISYALRDCLDWRPSKANGTTSYYGGWEYKYPGTSQGILIPNNFSNVQNIYQYYLGRKDLLVLTKDSQFQIIEGSPSVSPLPPSQPNGSLLLANLSLDPYTAYVPGQAPDGITSNLSIDKVVHKRWAKSDITDLQTQVNNLEYYTTLNSLEQAASGLSVSNSNGVTRPNYGILVDDFNSFAAADTTNPNYAANINIRKGQMGPITSVNNFQLQNPVVMSSLGNLSNTNSNNYAINNIGGTATNIFTLPYTTANLVVQQLASNTVSVNPFSVVTYQGIATLNPPMDNWVNAIEVPSILITDPTLQVNQQAGGLNLANMGDFASLPGTTSVVSATQSGVSTLSGTNSTSAPLQQGGSDSSTSFVAVPTQTYVSQITGLNNAQTSTATSPALTATDGYVTNNAVLPNIRAQEVIVRAQGMLVNTPVDCWFDGKKVNEWMTMPNTIEVTGVTGTFNQDDIIGFYESNISTFFPVARVVSVYKYPNSTAVRLYVATMIQVPQTVTTSTIQNAFFDSNGVYQGLSASGTVTFTDNSFHSLHNSGTVAGIGGTFTSATNSTATNIFATEVVSNWSSFMNTYGVWGDQNNGSSYSATFPFKPTANGTYTVTYAGDSSVSGSITVGGTTIVSGTLVAETSSSTTVNLTAGVSANVSWSLTNSGVYQWYAGPGVAVSITDPSGNIVWNSRTPTGLSYTNGSEYQMPGGGSLFVGATQLQLSSSANTSNGFYVGATISVKSTYTYNYNYGSIYYPPYPPFSGDADSGRVNAYNTAVSQYNNSINNALTQAKNSTITLSSTAVMTANITAYNGRTRTVTVDTPVNVSFGTNSIYNNLNSQYNITGTNASVAAAIHNGTGIPKLSTDEHGQFVAIFNIPGSVFYTGQRIFRIDNRVIPTQPDSASTYAESTFYATGLQTINQNLNYAASVDASATTLTRTNQQGYNITSQQPNIDPVAQTFIISKQNYPNGVFLDSVKLFFAPFTSGVTPNSPVTVSIVGTLNGYPNGQTLPHSQVTLNAYQINTSLTPNYLNSSTSTTFKFDAPVYVQSGVLYAIVVESSSADYNLYFGEQNKIAIASTANTNTSTTATKIGQAPYIGALFESQNSITWTADQTKDLMFVIDQCIFNTSVNPNISFIVPANLPSRKLGRQDIMQKFSANSVPNVYSYYEQDQEMDALNVSTTDFVPSSTNINYQYQTTLSKNNSVTGYKSITPGRFGTPTQDNLYLNDGNGERILLRSSNNSFSLLATLSSNDPNVSPVISDDGVSLYSIIYHVNNMGIDTSAITLANTGASYNANTMSVVITSGLTGSNTTNDLGVADLPVFGYTTNTTTGAISTLYVTYPGSGYIVTPSVSIYDPTTRTSATANAQIVISGETSSTGGNGYAKYFTKKVIMPPGNDAGDMRVYIDAYKPIGSQIYVYYKILSSADGQVFENQNWQLMTNTMSYTTYSTDRTNIIEYEYAPGINNLANNNISYVSTSGITYNNFIQFAIKVVISTPDRTNVPFLQDIRTVALPSGTGI
jgi:hypothetical protein